MAETKIDKKYQRDIDWLRGWALIMEEGSGRDRNNEIAANYEELAKENTELKRIIDTTFIEVKKKEGKNE